MTPSITASLPPKTITENDRGVHEVRTIILGAGASRVVSYAHLVPMFSPLDGDFYDLLQRLEAPHDPEDAAAVEDILSRAKQGDLWESMERMFYTLDLRCSMEDMLFPNGPRAKRADEFRRRFARSVQVLLKAAHAPDTMMECQHHEDLFEPLGAGDAIITFNYDLVAESALRKKLSVAIPGKGLYFPEWLYGFRDGPDSGKDCPRLYKLHGSVNWQTAPDDEGGVRVRQIDPKDPDAKEGYGGDPFLMMLPFWDKKIEEPPWDRIWKLAGHQLIRTTNLVVWGYSLPPTDIKSRELFNLTLKASRTKELVVIDISRDARMRWRRQFIEMRFRQYESVEKYLAAEGLA